MKKVLITSLCALTLLFSSAQVYAQESEVVVDYAADQSDFADDSETIDYEYGIQEQSDELEDIEIEITDEQLLKGITVLLTRNPDGSINQLVDDEDIEAYLNRPKTRQKRSVGDGAIEIATFHVGFNNWNNDTGRLYLHVSADEAIFSVSGNAYVKSTDELNPKSYHDANFSLLLRGTYEASRVLNEHVNTGKEKKVRVGFKNVILTSNDGEAISFANKSSLVAR